MILFVQGYYLFCFKFRNISKFEIIYNFGFRTDTWIGNALFLEEDGKEDVFEDFSIKKNKK